jgi:hypothetical protein
MLWWICNLHIDSWSFFETGWEVLCYGGFVH